MSRSRMVLAATVAALSAVAGSYAQVPKVMTMAAPPEGTTGYLLATGVAKAITDFTPVDKVILQVFGGASGWQTRMQSGEVNLGQHCGFKQMQEAYLGEGPYKAMGPLRNIRAVATGYGLPFGIHVTDPNIKTLADLRGKTLFVLAIQTDQRVAMETMLKAIGLTYGKDVRIIAVRSPQESLQGLSTGRGDGMFYGVIPALVEIQRGRGLHTLPVPAEIAKKVLEAEPVWGMTAIRAGTPPLNLPQDVPTLAIECGLAAGAQTDAETVYLATRALYEHHATWSQVHPLARQWTLKKATQIFVVPFHDGAVRYFREQGVWTPALEARQQGLLAAK